MTSPHSSSRQRSNHKRNTLSARETFQLFLGSVILLSYRGVHRHISTTSRLIQIVPTDDPTYSSSIATDHITANKFHIVNGESICLVHVGKTAGSYVSCRLGLTYAPQCNQSMASNSSLLAKHTNHYLHLYENSCHRMQNVSNYLITVRNPVARILSWWAYEKPKRAKGGPRMKRKRLLWLDCYSNVQDMASQGLLPLEPNERTIPAAVDQMTCRQRAWAAILGERKFGDHNYYNYAYYRKEMEQLAHSKSTIIPQMLVLRTEHLEQDWNHLERLLSTKNATVSSTPTTSTVRVLNQGNDDKHNELSIVQSNKQAMQNLCSALCEEIQVYIYFLKNAMNLSPFEVSQSMNELQQTCPDERLGERSCPPNPAFPPDKNVKRSFPK